jgi:chromosome segregation ATPase
MDKQPTIGRRSWAWFTAYIATVKAKVMDHIHAEAVDAANAIAGDGQAADDSEIESLRKLTADLGEELNTLRAEVRDHEDARTTIALGYDLLAEALWGNEEGRPQAANIDIDVLAWWAQLRDRHVAQMAAAARLIEAAKADQRGAVAAELAEAQKQLELITKGSRASQEETTEWEKGYDKLYRLLGFTGEALPGLVDTNECIRIVAERIGDHASERQSLLDQLGDAGAVLAERDKELQVALGEVRTMEGQLQTHERILDQLWETVHPGQEQDDDADPEQLAAQILGKWADLGREQQETDRAVEAAGGQTLDGLAELQKRVRELGDVLRAKDSRLVADFEDIFGPATPGLLGGNALVEPAELALGKQMGDAIAAVAFGEGRG